MKKFLALFLFCLGSTALVAQYEEHKSPEQIEQELQSAEAQFQRAKKMFNPWYTGPLQTPGASMMPPGSGNIQPYLYVFDNYAKFDSERKSHKLSSHLISVNPTVGFQFGMTPSTDIQLSNVQGFGNWQNGHSGGGFGDLNLQLGFLINKESRYAPAMRFVIKEVFPTGAYQHLNSNGLNLGATGAASYQSQFTFAMSKVMFWDYLHPVNARLAFSYVLPTSVTVRGFNNYGGGFGTRAKVHPGNTFNVDASIEISLTQRWVLATDFLYTATNRTRYSGFEGTTESGGSELASIGGGYNDNLSLAPAIEYNWSPNLGILGGVWFSVYGRNSYNFVCGVISFAWTYKVN